MSTATQEASAGPVAGSSASPYELRRKEFRDARKAAGNDAQLLFLNDETELLQELELADDELDEKEHNAALQRMTNAQVQKHIHAMIVPRAALELQEKYYQDIIYADPRNERGNPMLMFNTYSSFFMTQVVSKQFRTVATELNKAERIANAAGKEVPGCAKKALELTVAAVLAANDQDHWRIDTEEPDKVQQLANDWSRW